MSLTLPCYIVQNRSREILQAELTIISSNRLQVEDHLAAETPKYTIPYVERLCDLVTGESQTSKLVPLTMTGRAYLYHSRINSTTVFVTQHVILNEAIFSAMGGQHTEEEQIGRACFQTRATFACNDPPALARTRSRLASDSKAVKQRQPFVDTCALGSYFVSQFASHGANM